MCVILERQEAFIVYYTCGIAPYSNTLIILAVRQMSSNSVQVRFLPLNEFRSGQVLPPNKLGGGGGIDHLWKGSGYLEVRRQEGIHQDEWFRLGTCHQPFCSTQR